MVITNKAIYIIEKNVVKRCILFQNVAGLTKCVPPSTCINEFIIHVPKEYDYCLITERRDEIMAILKKAYVDEFNDNLAIYGVDTKDCAPYTTT